MSQMNLEQSTGIPRWKTPLVKATLMVLIGIGVMIFAFQSTTHPNVVCGHDVMRPGNIC